MEKRRHYPILEAIKPILMIYGIPLIILLVFWFICLLFDLKFD